MLRLRQILQKLGDGVSQNTICKEHHCSKRTVSGYRKIVDSSGKSIEELLALPDTELEPLFLSSKASKADDERWNELDRLMPEIVQRLNRKYANIQFVYEDFYQRVCPDGYGYTQFKHHVNAYREKHDYAYHNQHEPGMEWQIDFAGDALYLTDRLTKVRQKQAVLVCVMPYSNLIFMMAMPKANTEWFFHGLNKGLEYMGCLPHRAKSDNMKLWVTKSDRYSLTFSDANVEWAMYYGIEPTACRVRKPRDKGAVEGAVNQIYKYVYARLAGETYHDLASLNSRIMELLDAYNAQPFKGSSRWDIFNNHERPRMLPLPEHMYRFRMRKTVKLGSSYHVCVGSERHFYSVPYKYVGQQVKVMWDVEYVEIYVGQELVCMHARSLVPYGYSTEPAHMPETHTAYEQRREQNAATLIASAARIGESVKWAVEDILTRTTFPQQAYGRCNALLSMARKYSQSRLEHACAMMHEETGNASYQSLCNILKNNRDLAAPDGRMDSVTPYNDNVRGAAAYTSIPVLGGKENGHE